MKDERYPILVVHIRASAPFPVWEFAQGVVNWIVEDKQEK